MARKIRRSNRDGYTLLFSDEAYAIEWKTGNLSRFFRNLWNVNEVLRQAWPKIKTDHQFAMVMVDKCCHSLRYYRDKYGYNSAPFYLVPKEHLHFKALQGQINRHAPVSIKGLQD
jgi:hypothetical protein